MLIYFKIFFGGTFSATKSSHYGKDNKRFNSYLIIGKRHCEKLKILYYIYIYKGNLKMQLPFYTKEFEHGAQDLFHKTRDTHIHSSYQEQLLNNRSIKLQSNIKTKLSIQFCKNGITIICGQLWLVSIEGRKKGCKQKNQQTICFVNRM